jgi:uncharacterized surface protein with fasciclin (FAS1) repeats
MIYIYKYKIAGILSVLLLIGLGYSSCQKTSLNEPAPAVTFRNAADFLKNNYEFTLFYAAIQKAGLADSLNGPGPFTVLAPDDNAFHLHGIRSAADFDKWSADSLKFFVKFHVLNRKLFTSDIPAAIDNLYLNSEGINLFVSKNLYSPVMINGDTVTRADLTMANGLVQVMGRVLKYSKGTVQSFLAGNPDLTIFVAALKKSDPKLWDSLKTESANPYTIIAPSNEAYLQYGMSLDSINVKSAASIGVLVRPAIYYPHHAFISDPGVLQYLGSNNPNSLTDGAYTVNIANLNLGDSEFVFQGPDIPPAPNIYGQLVSPTAGFAAPWALSIDNLTTNGVIDIINDVPALAYRK